MEFVSARSGCWPTARTTSAVSPSLLVSTTIAGVRFERVQRFLERGFDHRTRRARLTQRRRELRDTVRLARRLFGHAPKISIAAQPAIGALGQQAESKPSDNVARRTGPPGRMAKWNSVPGSKTT